jgi:hypothetical protein
VNNNHCFVRLNRYFAVLSLCNRSKTPGKNLTKKEDLRKEPPIIIKRRLSLPAIAVIAVVAVIIVGGVTASYIAFRPGAPSPSPTPTASPSATSAPTPTPSPTPTPTPTPTPSNASSPTPTPSPTPSPTPTPTPSPTPTPTPAPTPTPTPTPAPGLTHTVDSTAIANGQADYWNLSITSPYTVVLNDTMTVSSGNQLLEIDGEWNLSATTPMWTVVFLNNTSFNFFVYGTNGNIINSGYYLPCNNGIVTITVTSTQITFTGTTPNPTSNVTFENLVQIASLNDGGNFTGGELDMTLTTP